MLGRPRTFDRDEAIDKAMLMFWEHGFESTSLAMLKAGMGDISAPSFYAAFNSKEELFYEVVERYIQTHGRVVTSLWDESLAPKDAIEYALRRSARMQTDRRHPLGCLLVLAAATGAEENRHIQQRLAQERTKNRAGIEACLQRAIELEDLPIDTDEITLAVVYDTFLQGLAVQARDGIPLTRLDAAITRIMRLWG